MKQFGLFAFFVMLVEAVIAVDLPTDFTRLEYIRSTGRQYIDTGYVHTPQTKIETEFDVSASGQSRAWAAAFGARASNYLHHCFCFFTHSGVPGAKGHGAAYARTGAETAGDVLFYGERISLCCDRAQATWRAVADPKRTGRITTTGAIDGGANTLFIFNLNTGLAGGKKLDPSPAAMKLYSFRISEGDSLKRDFVPCRTAAGEAGLWERVEGRFYANQGTGKFATPDTPWVPAAVSIMTPWGEKVTPENAWREYPRPQMVRANWTNLNGLWDYAVTPIAGCAGRPVKWDGKVLVPFALESALSGVGRLVQPTELIWYTRTITCSKKPGERLLLHFGGVDYRTMVFIGHREVTDVPHEGGQNPWTLDITDFVVDGANELTVCVWDPTEDFSINSLGKQRFQTGGCVYTRMSGIWQTVWMESVPTRHIRDYKVVTDIDRSTVSFTFDVGGADGLVTVDVDGVGQVKGPAGTLSLTVPNARLWSPSDPHLYTFTARFGTDEVKGYFGMRKISKGKDKSGKLRFFLNNQPTFLMGTLDQGWWPESLLTPPSDEAMVFDIQTLKNYGFNMMRKHMKIEPLRYYYLCDKLGIWVLQDLPPAAAGSPRTAAAIRFATQRYQMSRVEQKEMMDVLQKVPSVVMWVPFNEGHDQPNAFLTHAMMDFISRYDPTRLVDGPSGWFDYEGGAFAHLQPARTKHKPVGECEAGDVIDMHYYRGPSMPAVNDRRICFLGEFGGLGQSVPGHVWRAGAGWGYGGSRDTSTPAGLQKVYLSLVTELEKLAKRGLAGSVYTQTTDVEVEVNGLITYDRKVLKLDVPTLKAAHERVIHAVEQP